MATKIETLRSSNTHAIAGCDSCDFCEVYSEDDKGSQSIKGLRADAKKHARSSGHITYVESVSSTVYMS